MKHFFIPAIVALFFISFAVRVLGLGAINQVVFDEVHFGKFVSSYCCTHERFFDIHPPVGKLLIAGGAYALGYRGEFLFDSIGQHYTNTSIFGLRIVPALAGALLPIIIVVLLRQAGVSHLISLVGGLAVALDNAFIVESRLIITDSILLSATFGALASAIAATRARKNVHGWLLAIFSGILAGIAVGTKFTGLVSGGLVFVVFAVHMLRVWPRGAGVWILRLLAAVLSGVAVYTIGWALHFSLLTMPGSGDVWGLPTGEFWTDVVHVHTQMVSANYNLTADHPYGSKWWTWPFMVRSVFYWQGAPNQFVYLLGNPLVWWGSFALLCFGFGTVFLRFARGITEDLYTLFSQGGWIFLLGYLVSFIPLMRVPRVLFLYHYLTPLLCSLLFGVWWLDRAFPKKNIVGIITTVCIVIGFIVVSPITYGFTLPQAWYDVLFSFTLWR